MPFRLDLQSGILRQPPPQVRDPGRVHVVEEVVDERLAPLDQVCARFRVESFGAAARLGPGGLNEYLPAEEDLAPGQVEQVPEV